MPKKFDKLFKIALVLICSQLLNTVAWSYEVEEDFYDDTTEVAEHVNEQVDEYAAESTEPSADESAGATLEEEEQVLQSRLAEMNLDDLLSHFFVDEPTDNLERLHVNLADQFGSSVDTSLFSASDLRVGPSFGADFDGTQYLLLESGYMRNGMDDQLTAGIIANPNVANLFQRHSALRRQRGIALPAAFAPLVQFVEGYIRSNARTGAEQNNGLTHRALATQVVRASFCFGNDPFMVLSKMRRETHFARAEESPTGAVGFSQMTGAGIREVQDQMSGNSRISMGNARSTFQQAVRCFTGLDNFSVPTGGRVEVQRSLTSLWGLDLIFGQIMTKAIVSYVKASGSYSNNIAGNIEAYRTTFQMYNGDDAMTRGRCLQKDSVPMREEYACDVISHFSRMSAQWNRYIARSTGRDRT